MCVRQTLYQMAPAWQNSTDGELGLAAIPANDVQPSTGINKIKFVPNYPFFQTGEKHLNPPQKPSKIL